MSIILMHDLKKWKKKTFEYGGIFKWGMAFSVLRYCLACKIKKKNQFVGQIDWFASLVTAFGVIWPWEILDNPL